MASVPVIDLFAGPGGLGEGFASAPSGSNAAAFRISLSVEKELWAHQTLRLRAFYRQFPTPPTEYWSFLRGEIGQDELFAKHPSEAREADREALRLTLGPDTASQLRELISDRVGRDEPWILIGGPPCQAYSLIGRSRNRGIASYVAEADSRQTLYIEYLQVLADHAPAVFVMENVKGLLSATLSRQNLFARIRDDLANPHAALRREGRRARQSPRYKLVPLAPGRANVPGDDPRDFVVCSERFGIPQARHRVIILGVREDLRRCEVGAATLLESRRKTTREALQDLPALRSGLSSGDDSSDAWLQHLLSAPRRPWFRELDPELVSLLRAVLTRVRVPKSDRGGRFVPARHGHGIGALGGFVNHETRRHLPADLDRYLFASTAASHLKRSPDLREFPAGLLPDHRNVGRAVSTGHFADRFRVQLASRPATTVTSHISKDGHYYIHFDPAQCRSLTVREAARLQTFPDDYFFCGQRTAQYQQVGNAVPVDLARQIARIVCIMLQ